MVIFLEEESKSKHLFPKRDACFLYYCHIPRGYCKQGRLFSHFLSVNITMRTSQHLVIVAIEVEIIRLVRVRAYRRVRFGKVERVRSHYRRY